MLAKIQMIIGGVRFSAKECTIKSIKINDSYLWAESNAIDTRKLQQYVNQGFTDMKVIGETNHLVGGRMFYLDALKAKAEKGETCIVVLGTGKVFAGKYLIKNIKDNFTDVIDDGRSLYNSWSINLERDGDS